MPFQSTGELKFEQYDMYCACFSTCKANDFVHIEWCGAEGGKDLGAQVVTRLRQSPRLIGFMLQKPWLKGKRLANSASEFFQNVCD